MAKVIPLKTALKGLIALILAIALVGLGGHWSDLLIANPHASLWIRWAGVAVAVVTVIPWLVITALAISTGDEYQRHVALVGTAIAFVGNILVHIALGVMQDAGIISWGAHLPELVAAAVVWLVSAGLAAIYYRLRP